MSKKRMSAAPAPKAPSRAIQSSKLRGLRKKARLISTGTRFMAIVDAKNQTTTNISSRLNSVLNLISAPV